MAFMASTLASFQGRGNAPEQPHDGGLKPLLIAGTALQSPLRMRFT